MKKIKSFIKSNIKVVVAFILGIIISGTGVYAATILFASNEVSYDNTSSGLTSTNVQDAIDELYTKAKSCKKIKDNTVYFAYGEPTTSSTTDYTTLGKNVFIAKNGDQKSVCIIINSKLHCFDNNNFTIEKKHVQQVFSDGSCLGSPSIFCDVSGFRCYIYSEGMVDCYLDSFYNSGVYERCQVDGDGSVQCYSS